MPNSDDCEHEKVLIMNDSGGEPRRVCPICDDVQVQTFDTEFDEVDNNE